VNNVHGWPALPFPLSNADGIAAGVVILSGVSSGHLYVHRDRLRLALLHPLALDYPCSLGYS